MCLVGKMGDRYRDFTSCLISSFTKLYFSDTFDILTNGSMISEKGACKFWAFWNYILILKWHLDWVVVKLPELFFRRCLNDDIDNIILDVHGHRFFVQQIYVNKMPFRPRSGHLGRDSASCNHTLADMPPSFPPSLCLFLHILSSFAFRGRATAKPSIFLFLLPTSTILIIHCCCHYFNYHY